METQQIVESTLRSAVRHAKAHGGSDKRAAAIWFVTCVYNELKKDHRYTSGYTVGRVLTVLKMRPTVAEAAQALGVAGDIFASNQGAETPPPSNTGVTTSAYEYQGALADYFRG